MIADATHAWFAVYSLGEGWFEFDSTNNTVTTYNDGVVQMMPTVNCVMAWAKIVDEGNINIQTGYLNALGYLIPSW